MDLASAKAVISGGASGLGLETARRVIEAGGKAVLLDVNEEQGAAAAGELGDSAKFIRTDVTSEDGVRAAIAEAATHVHCEGETRRCNIGRVRRSYE